MSYPIPGFDPSEVNPDIDENDREEDTVEDAVEHASYHWGKIKEIAALLEVQAKDLQEMCKDLENNPLFPKLK